MKIAMVIGTRPQYVKATLLKKGFGEIGVEVEVFDTKQHYDNNMSTGVMGWDPRRLNLDDLKKYQVVVVIGDTDSTLLGACLGKMNDQIICHVEAGIRNFDQSMKEEINRTIVDSFSDVLLCPTKTSVTNLNNEKVKGQIYQTGDVLLDAFLSFKNEAAKSRYKNYSLLTLHRAENVDNKTRLWDIISGLPFSEQIVFPIHPRTDKLLNWDIPENIERISPVSYLGMLGLEMGANKIYSDSGGVQREAFFMGKEYISLRDRDEWPETRTGSVADFGDGYAYRKIADIVSNL